MKKNKKFVNILNKKALKELLKKNGIKIGEKALTELELFVENDVKELLKAINYQLLISGKKVAKVDDVKKAIEKLKKQEEIFEI